MLLFLDIAPNDAIVEFRERFGHNFIDFFINQFVFLVPEHFLELGVTIFDISEADLVGLNAYVGKIFILPHFDQIS